MYYILFIYFSVDEHLGCFHVLSIVNNAVSNMDMQLSLCDPAFNPLEYMLKSRTPGSHSSFITSFVKDQPFFTAVMAFYIPTNSMWYSIVSTSLSTLLIFC